MNETYAVSSWIFTRALALVYLITFLSLFVQAKGLWGARGVMPMAPLLKSAEQQMDAHRFWQVPSIFWLSASDEMMVGVAMTGAVGAALALFGFSQGWSLLLCFGLYLSFCSAGQEFMSFQWDALLLEVGFLGLFLVPWNFDFSFLTAQEPHWLVRYAFYFVLFKLMFLSGIVKLMSGDESWRDLTALSYHFWTQPLPNPLSPFFHALPMWVHKTSTALTFAVELGAPFLMFWPRTRVWAAAAFAGLSFMILVSGNYTFFNWLTLALCVWLVPDSLWEKLLGFLPFELQTMPATVFPHPFTASVMAVLILFSALWCLRFWIPDRALATLQPALNFMQRFHISNSYGLFANMTKNRPEIVIEGSLDGKEWREYEFKYKAGNVYRMPPIVAPYQPRLDWQMWFAALGSFEQSPWLQTLMLRLAENSPDVMELLDGNPFGDRAPKFLRARLYEYEFTSPEEVFESGKWWNRKLLGEFSPTFASPEH